MPLLPDDIVLDHEPAEAVSAHGASAPSSNADYVGHIKALVDAGASADDVRAYVKGLGGDPSKIAGLEESIAAHRAKQPYGVKVDGQGVDTPTHAEAPIGGTILPDDVQIDPPAPDAPTGTLSGLAPEEVKARYDAMPVSMRPGMADMVAHGMLAGLDTEAAGIADAVGSTLLHPIDALESRGASIADAYHAGRKDVLSRIDYARMQHPAMAPITEAGGAILNPIGAEASGLSGLAKVGAGYGAVSGFEGGDAPIEDRLASGAKGAAIGAVAAPVIGAALRAPSAVINAGKSVINGSPGLARRIVSKAIKADGNTAAQVAGEMQAAGENGVPYMMADSGDNVRGLLAAAVRSPGPARTMARDALEQRQEGLAERVVSTIERDLGPVVNPHKVADDLMTNAHEAASPLYERVYSAPPVSSPAIDNLLQRPSMQRALGNALRIAKEEGRDPKELGFELDVGGNVVLRPVNVDLYARQASARSALTDAQEELKKLRLPGSHGDLPTAINNVSSARDELRAADAALNAAPSSGTAQTSNHYTMQTLDYVKRGMDDLIESYRDPTSGRLNLDTEGRAINNTLRGYLSVLDKINPDYAAARAAYAGPVRAIDAMNAGRKSLNMTADDLEARIREMTPFDKQMFALGARRAMAEAVSAKGDSANVINTLIGTGKKRAMLARLFGDRKQFARFVDTMGQEREAFRTFQRGMLGSPTATNLQDDAALQMASLAADAVTTGLPIATAIQQALKFGIGRVGTETKKNVAALLSETDPARFHELARQLRDEATRRGLVGQKIGRVVTHGIAPGVRTLSLSNRQGSSNGAQ